MLHRANELTSLILKGIGILFIGLASFWIIISIWGNIAIHQAEQPVKVADPPSIATAPYKVDIKATGEVYYARSYTMPSKGVYILNGYYAAPKSKWIYYKIPLPIDEKYWGTVTVTPRSK